MSCKDTNLCLIGAVLSLQATNNHQNVKLIQTKLSELRISRGCPISLISYKILSNKDAWPTTNQ